MGYKDKVHVTAVSILLEAAAHMSCSTGTKGFLCSKVQMDIGPLSNSRTRISLQKVHYNLHDIAIQGTMFIWKMCLWHAVDSQILSTIQ